MRSETPVAQVGESSGTPGEEEHPPLEAATKQWLVKIVTQIYEACNSVRLW
jgi:hypothetical protein